MTDLSRRGMLPIVAAALAATISDTQNAAAAADNSDARLFELKQEFDHIVATREQVDVDAAEAFAEFDRRLEILREDRTLTISFLREVPGHDAAISRLHELDTQLDRLMAQMQAHGATTRAGLATIATAMKQHDLSFYWNETDQDADWTDLQTRPLIDTVIAFGGGPANA